MGRPTKYDETFPDLAEGFAAQGLSDEQIAHNLGIGVSNYYKYQNDFAEFKEAIKRGKRPVDKEVENALLKRALGYSYEEKHTEIQIDEHGQPKPKTIKTIKKEIAPDVGAIAFWLKNRKPDTWKERQTIGLNKVDKLEISYEGIHED